MQDTPIIVPEQPAINPEDEIRELERKLAEKRAAFAQGQETVPAEEKEMLRETLREHIEQIRTPSGEAPHPSVPSSVLAPQSTTPMDPDEPKHREEQVRALIEIALTKSIRDAVKVAQANSPYLLDELHDHLVDEYYDKLVQLGKIQAA